jgi:hypothetical protein
MRSFTGIEFGLWAALLLVGACAIAVGAYRLMLADLTRLRDADFA